MTLPVYLTALGLLVFLMGLIFVSVATMPMIYVGCLSLGVGALLMCSGFIWADYRERNPR